MTKLRSGWRRYFDFKSDAVVMGDVKHSRSDRMNESFGDYALIDTMFPRREHSVRNILAVPVFMSWTI